MLYRLFKPSTCYLAFCYEKLSASQVDLGNLIAAEGGCSHLMSRCDYHESFHVKLYSMRVRRVFSKYSGMWTSDMYYMYSPACTCKEEVKMTLIKP